MSTEEDKQTPDSEVESGTESEVAETETEEAMDSSESGNIDGGNSVPDDQTQAAASDTDSQESKAEDELPADKDDSEVQEDTPEMLIESLQQQLVAAKEQADKQKDLALRAKAEEQNARRRARIDVEKAHKYSIEKFGRELLSVIDSLERAVESVELDTADETVKAIHEGVELTLKMFQDAFKKFNLEQIDPGGEPFDPRLHQAISMQENDNVEPNTILTVVQKGYILSERTLRPAMVIVSKASANTSSKIDEKA